ncbi:MAG TPA: hypothetical protein VEI02_00095, partial [Planctomycetota bacterium]|nr:hypothetical protein [Planctomycetota bacterium]
TLGLLDQDGDDRVRAPEILAAVEWLSRVLKDFDLLVQETDGVPISAIETATVEGRRLAASARMILENLGRPGDAAVTVADAARTGEFFKVARWNGDGVVPPEAFDDPALRAAAVDVVACTGGQDDRSGKRGFNRTQVESFFAECRAFADWWAASETDARILPLGARTHDAFAAYEAVRAKIDDYFARCRLAAYDPRAQEKLNGEESRYLELAAVDLAISSDEVKTLPLARIGAGKPLHLREALNPAWADAVEEFRAKNAELLEDRDLLTEEAWRAVVRAYAPHAEWRRGRRGGSAEKLGVDRVRNLLAGDAERSLVAAAEADAAVAPEISAITEVERLARYVRDLHRLLVNFVTFSDFYARKRDAVFQAGTLYLDGRSCELCFRVPDPGKTAATLATMASSYLAYCDLTRPGGEKMTVACAFTAGDSDHLVVGRNGLFYDRRGRDWDATITRIVDHPISVGQAFFAPYKRFLRWVETQVAKRAAAADAEADALLVGGGSSLVDSATAGEGAPKPPPAKSKFDVGVIAAMGVAVGGITTAMSIIVGKFIELEFYMPLGVLAVILLISGPSMAIAWLKLRQRNLGPILDSIGWAVNGRVKVNIPLGASLTDVAKLPAGAERSLADPFAEKRPKWPRRLLWSVVLLVILVGVVESGILGRYRWYREAFRALPYESAQRYVDRLEAKYAKAPGGGPGGVTVVTTPPGARTTVEIETGAAATRPADPSPSGR